MENASRPRAAPALENDQIELNEARCGAHRRRTSFAYFFNHGGSFDS